MARPSSVSENPANDNGFASRRVRRRCHGFEHVAGEEDIDTAMRFGANYPAGPFAWADLYGRSRVRGALAAIAGETGEVMYCPSQYMRNWK